MDAREILKKPRLFDNDSSWLQTAYRNVNDDKKLK